MKRFFRGIIRMVLVISGFLFIFNLPALYGIGKDSVTFNFQQFWTSIINSFAELIHVKDAGYLEFIKKLDVMESYEYTMTILGASLLFVLFAGILITILVMSSPIKLQYRLKNALNIFEAVPDLLVIFLFMIFVITLYKTTGLKFLQLYGIFGKKPYFVPIMTVSFLPLFFFVQFLIKVVSDEQNQLYVLYVKAKGIGRFRILLVHIMQNIFSLTVLQLRTIVWVILSNIYLVEYIFNINGFTKMIEYIIFRGGDFPSLVSCILMFVVPLVLVEAGGLVMAKFIKGKEGIGI